MFFLYTFVVPVLVCRPQSLCSSWPGHTDSQREPMLERELQLERELKLETLKTSCLKKIKVKLNILKILKILKIMKKVNKKN